VADLKNFKIIHKFVRVNGDYFYLCNQAVQADWRKTDIANKKVNCKNCKKILKKTKGET